MFRLSFAAFIFSFNLCLLAADDSTVSGCLLVFTDKKHCPSCRLLEKHILATEEFSDFCKNSFKVVTIPCSLKTGRAIETDGHHEKLRKLLSITVYPTVCVLDSQYTPKLMAGYRKDGPRPFIEQIRMAMEQESKLPAKEKEIIQAKLRQLLN